MQNFLKTIINSIQNWTKHEIHKSTADWNRGLANYVQKTELPTKTSQLENDSGYLTEHQDISGKLDATKLPEAINAALAQAKESGEFDGKDGNNYVLTDDDRTAIAEQAAELVEVPEGGNVEMKPLTFTGAVNATYDGSEAVEVVIPTDAHINDLINTALGVIENGTY